LGLSDLASRAETLRSMDAANEAAALDRVGEAAAARFVTAEHFPPGFDYDNAAVPGPRETARGTTKPLIFVSYSQKDEKWKERLLTHLAMLELQVETWSDSNIEPGEDWSKKMAEVIENAAVAICLISPDFLASDHIREREVPELLKRWQE